MAVLDYNSIVIIIQTIIIQFRKFRETVLMRPWGSELCRLLWLFWTIILL